jgi:hypothetical protein
MSATLDLPLPNEPVRPSIIDDNPLLLRKSGKRVELLEAGIPAGKSEEIAFVRVITAGGGIHSRV